MSPEITLTFLMKGEIICGASMVLSDFRIFFLRFFGLFFSEWGVPKIADWRIEGLRKFCQTLFLVLFCNRQCGRFPFCFGGFILNYTKLRRLTS